MDLGATMTDYRFELILVVGILAGLRLMRRPRTAVTGNLLSSVCMLVAVVLTVWRFEYVRNPMILTMALLVGAGLGSAIAWRVAMVQMPQLVALLNGFGGAASALVALNALWPPVYGRSLIAVKTGGGLALSIGILTLAGSLIAAAKLAGWLDSKPRSLPANGLIEAAAGIAVFLLIVSCAVAAEDWLPFIFVLLIISAALFGVVMTLRVGGADMPIVISLLNSLSGVAAAFAGFTLANPLLVATGGIVGAAGLILTEGMCRAMNRSLAVTLRGVTPAVPANAPTAEASTAMTDMPMPADEGTDAETRDVDTETALDLADCLKTARKIMIVPGYGMAVAQAQDRVKILADRLEELGGEVMFAVHPVAGRMPGHMNVLLAEVDVDYEKLLEIDDANAVFRQTDLVVVVGANDVVNPAAGTAEGTPIYGMPVLNVVESGHVIVCNLDRKPGYAGVDNPLYDDSRVTFIEGDARKSVDHLLAMLE